MSISTLQEKFFNKGCGTVLIGALSIAMVATMFMRGNGSSSQGPNGGGESEAVATVGGVPVTAALIQERSSQIQTQAIQQRAQETKTSPDSMGPPDAALQSMAIVNATNQMLQLAAVQSILAKDPPSDAEIQAFATSQIEERIMGARTALEKQGKLKPGAGDADLEKALKDSLGGKTLAQIRAEAPKDLLGSFKNPSTKTKVLESFGGALLVKRYGAKLVGSDQGLRDSYRNYVVRRILLSPSSGAKDSPEVRAAKVEADLKAGKSFEAEMDAYSNDPPSRGKSVHDLSESLPATDLDSRAEYASLRGMANGATTGIVDVAGGKAIGQLVSTIDGAPKDFEKNKAQLRSDQTKKLGDAELEKRVRTILGGEDVKWQSPGYQALAVTAKALQSMGTMQIIMDPAADKAAIAAAQTALKSSNSLDRKLGAQALLVATDPKLSISRSPEGTANRRAAIETAQTSGIEDVALSLELADLCAEAKDGAKATASLVAASKANNRYDAEGERLFRAIAAKGLELQKKSVLTKDQLESVQAQQATWSASRAENEKAATQAKTDEASEKAANDAEIARQKAEAAKTTPAAGASDAASKAANEAEIARQKAEVGKSTPSKTAGTAAPAGKGR